MRGSGSPHAQAHRILQPAENALIWESRTRSRFLLFGLHFLHDLLWNLSLAREFCEFRLEKGNVWLRR